MVEGFANTIDYEEHARLCLDKQTFEHLQGNGQQPAEYQDDFNLIKLKLNGMANMKYFQGLGTEILGQKYSSPVALGPLPAVHDVNLALDQKHPETVNPIQKTCNDLGQLFVIPLCQSLVESRPHLVHVVPTKDFDPTQILKTLNKGCIGIVLETGYRPKIDRDAKNRYPFPDRLKTEESEKPFEQCCFKFDMIRQLK